MTERWWFDELMTVLLNSALGDIFVAVILGYVSTDP